MERKHRHYSVLKISSKSYQGLKWERLQIYLVTTREEKLLSSWQVIKQLSAKCRFHPILQGFLFGGAGAKAAELLRYVSKRMWFAILESKG